AAPLVRDLPGTVWPLLHDFWCALAVAMDAPDTEAGERDPRVRETAAAAQRFDALARHCAENFGCPALLLRAEVERLQNQGDAALALYAQAIEFANERPLLPFSALAHECCGRHLLALARPALGRMHLAQARAYYARWGAHAKVHAMQAQYDCLVERG